MADPTLSDPSLADRGRGAAMRRGADLFADIDYIRAIAETGETAPSLSGRFAFWWSSLGALAFLIHWAAAAGVLTIGGAGVGLIWFSYVIIGTAGSIALGRTVRDKPGGSTPGNRMERTVWYVVIAGLVIYQSSVVAGVVLGRLPFLFYDTIPAAAFLIVGVMAAASAVLYRERMFWWTTAVAFASMSAMILLAGAPAAYLAGACGMLLGVTAPAVAQLRREPAAIV